MNFRKSYVVMCILVTCGMLIVSVTVFKVPSDMMQFILLPLSSNVRGHFPLPKKCGGVLYSATKGRWVHGKATCEQEREMDDLLRESLAQHKLPWSLEREDGRCGNISYDEKGLFRALCNPRGDRPCCKEHVCVQLSPEQCVCPGCRDLRARIYPEFASWMTSDPRCQFRNFSPEEACDVSRGSEFVLVGDSLTRHLTTALVLLLTGNPHDGGLKHGTSQEVRKQCFGSRQYTIIACRKHLLLDGRGFCNSSLNISFLEVSKASSGALLKRNLQLVLHRPNVFFFVNLGLHEFNNAEKVFSQFVRPSLDLLNRTKAVWPKFLWVEVHAPGLLKSPNASHWRQDDKGVKEYNQAMSQKLRPFNVPILDTYNFTQGVDSYDGTHYAMGVNVLKAQILLNYVAEVRLETD